MCVCVCVCVCAVLSHLMPVHVCACVCVYVITHLPAIICLSSESDASESMMSAMRLGNTCVRHVSHSTIAQHTCHKTGQSVRHVNRKAVARKQGSHHTVQLRTMHTHCSYECNETHVSHSTIAYLATSQSERTCESGGARVWCEQQ